MHTKHYIYPIWLRFFALFAAFAAFVIFVGPSFLFSSSDASLPWNDQERIFRQGQKPQFQLSEDQPELTHVLRYKAWVELDDQPRGEINVLIYPDGIVKGVWNGEYDRPEDIHCVVMAASFAGNIDPDRQYIEDGERDTSKLYFITAGAYNLFERVISTKQPRNVSGFLYVRGWLDPNYAVVGELIITEDKKTLETFSWTATPVN